MKLSPITIILIGVAILIMTLSYGFFQHWMPNTTEAGYYNNYAAQLEEEGNKLPQAQNRLKKAEEMVRTKAAEWRAVVATRTPLPDVNARGVNLHVDPWQLTVDTKKFRDNIQRAVNAQLVKGGVKVVGNGPSIPAPTESASEILAGFYNYPAIAFPVVIFDLGQVTVEGTESQIYENVRAWKSMPRFLAVTDGLTITGTSPNLRGTYSVSLVGFIRGKQIFPTVPDGASPSSSGGGAPGGGAGPGVGAPGAAPGVGKTNLRPSAGGGGAGG